MYVLFIDKSGERGMTEVGIQSARTALQAREALTSEVPLSAVEPVFCHGSRVCLCQLVRKLSLQLDSDERQVETCAEYVEYDRYSLAFAQR